MRADRFDYDLPRERIAEEAAPRGESRLMVVGEGVEHTEVSALPTLLRRGDLVVVNNTRVLPARLYSTRAATGGRVEILLVEKVGERTWQALLKPARRLRKGERLVLEPGLEGSLAEDPVDGRATLDLTRPAEEFLPRLGHVPLPPYIHRADNTHDRERYQTVYASEPGAIAAPTAGLHFGDEDLEALRAAGVEIVEITLHVGIGTFRPVSVDEVAAHVMDAERYRIDGAAANAIEAARSTGRRIVAVGTTVVRTLESVLREGGPLRACEGRTDLFIYPGFEFRVVDVLLTNFHLPRSTLLMLVSAFAGTDRVLDAYREAIRERYRFYSYGDAMLLTRAP